MSDDTTYHQSTLFAADSLASLTVSPGSAEARQMTVTSGRNIAGLLTSSGPLGSLLRMCLESEQLSSTRCYLTWVIWNTPRRRLLFRLVPSMPRTAAIEFGFWPTATATDAQDRVPGTPHLTKNGTVRHANRHGTTNFMRLSQVAKLYPTPTSTDANKWNNKTAQERREKGHSVRLPNVAAPGAGGQLNPTWVEWLMGFPIGWTELEHSETP